MGEGFRERVKAPGSFNAEARRGQRGRDAGQGVVWWRAVARIVSPEEVDCGIMSINVLMTRQRNHREAHKNSR
jgi:hypothetical protein